jgi:hypothetical protein
MFDWQLVPVVLVVAMAAWYLGRVAWRSWRGSRAGCGGGCDCAAKPGSDQDRIITPDQLTARLRQGRRV